jgi:hypothetical protein
MISDGRPPGEPLRYPGAVRLPALLLVLAAPLLGCVNTDTAIFVDPTLSDPTATVTSLALGTGLSGSFTLDLHLGARAAGPSTVKLGQFALLDATQTTTIVPALTLTDDVPFPATVDQNSDVIAHFTFNTGVDPLPPADKAQLCATAGVVISGAIEDSLAGRSVPFSTGSFNPTCM